MLKSMIEKIEAMAAPTMFNVEGSSFCNKDLKEIKPRRYHTERREMSSLDSLCTMVRKEADRSQHFLGQQIVVRVANYQKVTVYTTLDEHKERDYLYECTADIPAYFADRYYSHDEMIIKVRSLLIPTADSAYLLRLLGSISKENNVSSMDNGVSQVVKATAGVALAQNVEVKPHVILKPFRTFLEVAQPESEFLLRIDENGRIALFESDGGVWKLEATRNIAAYLEDKLSDLIEGDRVIVLR